MIKKAALIFVTLSVLTTITGALAFPPMHSESATIEQDGTRTEKSYKRYWEFLPLSMWGFTPSELIADGGNGGGGTYTRRFGFIGLSEDHWTAFVKVMQKRNPVIDIAAKAR